MYTNRINVRTKKSKTKSFHNTVDFTSRILKFFHKIHLNYTTLRIVEENAETKWNIGEIDTFHPSISYWPVTIGTKKLIH